MDPLPSWDLSELYASPGDPRIEDDLKEADREADAFLAAFRGRIASLEPGGMGELLTAYEGILERIGRISAYAFLHWSTNTEDSRRGALLQRATEASSRLYQKLLFLELEWAQAGEEHARLLIASPALARWRHWLRQVRRFRPHLLSEPEEKILAEKSVTGRSAWARYFEEIHSAHRYLLEGEAVSAQAVLSKLYEPDREVRRRAARSLTEGLRVLSRSSTYVLNTILADKASDDRLRSYPTWISARNLDNQIDDATVQALVGQVTSRYDIVARYYNLKRRLLKLSELIDYDRYAPLPRRERRFGWPEAREAVLEAAGSFHPRLGEITAEFFEKRWIDAAVAPGKRSGAYSHGTVPSAHPYVFLNYQGFPRDVMTLAHELGHGAHQYLARGQGILQAETPLTLAETASVFSEMLVFHSLLERENDKEVRLSMLVEKIEEIFATVFRQIAMNRFEEAAHQERRARGELSTERFTEIWLETQRAMFADSLALSPDYGIWWSYIPHFIHTPGYVYAYGFGELLVLALFTRYREQGRSFADGYLKLLASGGSDWPEELVKPLGVDLKDPGFWSQGLKIIEEMVGQAEEMAEA